MSAPRYAQCASALLVRHGGPAPSGPSPDARAEAVERLAAALSARGRRRRLVRRVAVWAAVAAAVATLGEAQQHLGKRSLLSAARTVSPAPAVQIVAHPLGDGASVVVSGSPAPLADGRQLGDGSRLVTPPGGRATLAFSTGTSVMLGEGTDLTVNGDATLQALRLGTGWVALHVATLRVGQRFLVATSDTEVEVRGTQFRVSLVVPDPACGGGTPTRVSVSEGIVTVRRGGVEAHVAAGQEWPAGCDRVQGASGIDARGSRIASQPRAIGAVPGSSLADQNDIFAEAFDAKRQGDLRGALAVFDRFLARYPAGPLTESAWVERLRLLHAITPTRAVAAAEQYIAAYPNGFARAEAEAIVAGTQ